MDGLTIEQRHQIRNAVTALLGHLQLVRMYHAASDDQRVEAFVHAAIDDARNLAELCGIGPLPAAAHR